MKNNKRLIGASVLAAITASLCCITPILALLAGTSGAASMFSWIEPFRPYLIGFTILVLAFAWHQQLRPKTLEELECACEENEKTSFRQSKKFLGIITVFVVVMLAFPYYSSIFYLESESNSTFAMSDNLEEITVDIKGMTCAGCEQHIEHAVGQLEGVNLVQASYVSGTATVHFLPSMIDDKGIVEAINGTGYQVFKKKVGDNEVVMKDQNINFYKVPLVCNAAPTIGCGSRAKPVLKDFEESKEVSEAWLNRSGTVIALVWKEESGNSGKESISKKHFFQASNKRSGTYFGRAYNYL